MPLLRRLRVAFRITAVGFLSSSVARLRVLEQPDPVGRWVATARPIPAAPVRD
jgi:hypothetical protein